MKATRWMVSFLLLVAAAPAGAAWLVLRSGKPIETAGPWQVVNNQVSFAQPDGKRVSLMLVVVDPEATRQANVPGAPPPAAQAGASGQRLVISNDTVKGNRVKGPSQTAKRLDDIGPQLSTIADCLTRYPNSAADYTRCSQPSTEPPR